MQDNGHEFTIHVNFIVKCICVIRVLDKMFICDRCSHFLMVGHYMTYIISSVGHLRSDSARLLVLWMVAYNGQGTDIILQVP